MTKESRYIEQKEIEIHVEILKFGAKLQLFFHISKKSCNFAAVLRKRPCFALLDAMLSNL